MNGCQVVRIVSKNPARRTTRLGIFAALGARCSVGKGEEQREGLSWVRRTREGRNLLRSPRLLYTPKRGSGKAVNKIPPTNRPASNLADFFFTTGSKGPLHEKCIVTRRQTSRQLIARNLRDRPQSDSFPVPSSRVQGRGGVRGRGQSRCEWKDRSPSGGVR